MQQRGNDDNKSHGKKRPLSSPSPCRVSVATRTRRSSKISKKKQKNNDNNNFASTIAEEDASKWRTTPLLFFIQTLGYLDNTSLIVLCQVCKQLCTIIQNGQGMATKLVRVFDLRPKFSIYGNSNRSRRFVTTMCPYSRNVALNWLHRGYQHWNLYDVEKFGDHHPDYVEYANLEVWTKHMRMHGIASLTISSSLPPKFTKLGSSWSCQTE